MKISWEQFDRDCERLAKLIKEHSYYNQRISCFYAIPKGGFFVAARIAYLLDINKNRLRSFTNLVLILSNDFIVDDFYDTGKTYNEIDMGPDGFFACLYTKERIAPVPSEIIIGRQLKTSNHVWMPWGD